MKKKVLSLAVLMASVFTFGSYAQAPSNNNAAACAKTECPAKANGDKACNRPNPFDGINLTADQQTRLQAIREQAKAARAEKKAQLKADQKQADAASRAARCAERVQNRKDYLGQIKEVLTPDQYVVFLENCYVQQAPNGKGGQMSKQARFDKKGKKDGKFAGKAKMKKDGKVAGKAKMKKDGKKGRRTVEEAVIVSETAVVTPQAN